MNKFKLTLAICAASALLAPISASAQMFDGRSIIGTGIGAGIGGAIGSNLAGGGVQDEGTAIGALVGGAIGYGLANSTRGGGNYGPYRGDYGSTYGGNYGPAHGGYNTGYNTGASRYGSNYPGNGYGYSNSGYSNSYSYGSSYSNSSYYTSAPAPVYFPQPQYVYGGNVVSQVYTVPHYTTYSYTPQVRTQIIRSAPSQYVAPELMSTYCRTAPTRRYDSHGHLITSGGCN